ncbi:MULTISPECIES: ATP-dependent DNA helicase RecG [unclassified Microcoleus]|uniref:ATP-dependent DNA helicase RecG n=1 Tax=unclassified Microcoleus TaxID=2642155 RepID=UPI002FD35143
MDLTLTLQHLSGIAVSEAQKLTKLGLRTIADLLYYFPKEHLAFKRTRIAETKTGDCVTIAGKIINHSIFDCRTKPELTLQKWIVCDQTDRIVCTQFYNHSYYQWQLWRSHQAELYKQGAIVLVTGKVKQDSYGKTISNPTVKVVSFEDAKASTTSIVPVYRLTKGITNELVRHCIRTALDCVGFIEDPLPQRLRKRFGLIALQKAIAHIHCPPDSNTLESARHRLVFDEFFYLQLRLLQHRYTLQQQQGYSLNSTGKQLRKLYKNLPFTLTKAQQRVIAEILSDMSKPTPMNRLVQGDVGAGKTVVAAVAILAAIQSGYQTALMAPTEVLASQHYRKLSEWFEPLGLSVTLLTGSTTAKIRQEIAKGLNLGLLPLLIGTHALIQNTVSFKKLGFVAIDEQHRFGVQQRLKLQQKGISPHILTMTATPIPRTLALTLHGDLDISLLDELPPGREPIQTQLFTSRTRHKAHEIIRQQIQLGYQAYIILPLVEESERLDLKAAIEEHRYLRENIFRNVNIGLLHGRMNSAEKETEIANFIAHKTQILVSTTVVEVGVDVPNATVMLIEHAERFGLSQLHQLRGRVGRSTAQSYCLLVSDSKSNNSRERLKIMETSQDGFFLAEMDLRLRGPGQVLGTQQAGLPEFAKADLINGQAILEQARKAAQLIVAKDPTLERWPELSQELFRRQQVNKLDAEAALN